MNRFSYPTATGGTAQPPMASKMTGLHIAKGDRLRLETPGGGGYGLPNERPANAIARDVALGYVTQAAANRDYPAQAKDAAQ